MSFWELLPNTDSNRIYKAFKELLDLDSRFRGNDKYILFAKFSYSFLNCFHACYFHFAFIT